jgi:FtsP/CotA-like multicopper oxidase with cupredoxin domain
LEIQRVSRRRFLVMAGGALTLTSCGYFAADDTMSTDKPSGLSGPPGPVRFNDPLVGAVENRRSEGNARIVTAQLTAAPMTVDLGGRVVQTWGYGGEIPGRVLRAKAGEVLDVKVHNNLPEATSIHWHGLALRNDMDGVNDLTQPPIGPGQEYTYRFALADPGTYWFHPHVGMQLDRGLYAPLIIDDPHDPGRYDAECVITLDDWLDGFDTTPDEVLKALGGSHMSMPGMDGGGDMGSMPGMDHGNPTTTMGPMAGMDHGKPTTTMGPMAGMDHGKPLVGAGQDEHGPAAPGANAIGAAMGRFSSDLLGGDAGDVAYPLHLINGRPPHDRPTFWVPAKGKARFRIINAGSDTAYRFAIGGHRLTVTHTDGYPIQPIEVDAILVGMGERYDVLVTPQSGAWPVMALAEGKWNSGVAVMRTLDAPVATTSAPPPDAPVFELFGRVLDYKSLRAADPVRLEGKPDRTIDVSIAGDMATYQWALKTGSGKGPITIEEGIHVRLNLKNDTTMWHPIHLHGHTFALAEPTGGARKDTVNVLPGQTVGIEFIANNPGQWMMHCHNTYHFEAGMMNTVSYVR